MNDTQILASGIEETLGNRDETLVINSKTAQNVCSLEVPGAWFPWDLTIACVLWAIGHSLVSGNTWK